MGIMGKHLYFSDCCVTIIILFYNVLIASDKTHIHFASHILSSSLLTTNHQFACRLCGFAYKDFVQRTHTLCDLLHLTFCNDNVLSSHVIVFSCVIASYGEIPSLGTDLPQFAHPSITTPELFHFLANVVCMCVSLNITFQVSGVYTQGWNSWALQ